MYIILDMLMTSKSCICFKCKCLIYTHNRYFHRLRFCAFVYVILNVCMMIIFVDKLHSFTLWKFHYAKILTNGNDMCNDMCNEPILIPFTGGFTRCTNCHTSSRLSFTMSNSRNRLVTTFIAGLKTKFNTISSTGSYFICICFNNCN